MTQTTHSGPAAPTGPPGPRRGLVPALSAALVLALVVITVLATLLLTRGGDSAPSAAAPSPSAEQTEEDAPSDDADGADGEERSEEVDVPEAEGGVQLDPTLLSFAPPELDDPETVQVTQGDRSLKLDLDQDYVVEMPDEPVIGGVSIYGGNDVVLIGGEISVPEKEEEDDSVRALYLRDQTGVMHVEGLALTGPGLGEGINLNQQEGGVVQLQNIRVGTVQGERDGHHADVIQTWSGPQELRIDRLSASSTYQGFFMLPQQFGEQDPPELFDLRRVDIEGTEPSAYLLWRDKEPWPLQLTDVWLSRPDGSEDPDDLLWPRGDGEGTEAWDDVQIGVPPGGPFVPEGVAGTDYTSPGYVG